MKKTKKLKKKLRKKKRVKVAKIRSEKAVKQRKNRLLKNLAIKCTKHAKRIQECLPVVKYLILQCVEIQTKKRDVEDKITKLKNEHLKEEKKSRTWKIHETFCICNLPTSDKKPQTPMVECSNCLRMYHFACIGLTVKDVYGLTRWDCHDCEYPLKIDKITRTNNTFHSKALKKKEPQKKKIAGLMSKGNSSQEGKVVRRKRCTIKKRRKTNTFELGNTYKNPIVIS